jgi:uncharacterized membrane-anchored protein YhcB (DUF1043 family)
MYDFIIGLAFGTLLTRLFTKKRHQDASTQVEFVSITTPIPIPKKSFVPGALANFWGKDS